MGLASEEHPLISAGLRPLRCGSEQVIQKDQLSQKERKASTGCNLCADLNFEHRSISLSVSAGTGLCTGCSHSAIPLTQASKFERDSFRVSVLAGGGTPRTTRRMQ